MNVIGGIQKALTKDIVGQLIGALATAQKYGETYGGGGWLEELDLIWGGLVNDPHFPDLEGIRYDLLNPERPMSNIFRMGLMGYLGGMIAKEVNIHPMLTKFGRIAEQIGLNAAIGSAAVAVAARSSHIHSPLPAGYHSSSGGSSSSVKVS